MAYHRKLLQGIKAALDWTRARASKFTAAAEWAIGRRTAQVLGVVMLFAIVVALLLVFLDWYINPTKPGDKKDLVLAMAQILAGTALLSGLYFTWRTLQVNREGQITERFTRAIDQLGKTDEKGNKLLEIRLGGIYALERIARESEEDHWPIMEVLIAYVRQHAPWRPGQAQEFEWNEWDSSEKSATANVPAPTADIQAIITVIRRRTRSFGYGEPEHLDLHGTKLSRANLSRADLSGVNLSGANLWGAILSGVNLSGANLHRAILLRADLSGADLSGADLSGANLIEARLWGANLSRADLSGAILHRAILLRANLTQEQLEETTGDENTELSPDLEPPADWNGKTDEQIEGE